MLKLAHLYPKYLNIYGDMGNIIAITRRCEWRDIEIAVEHIDINEHDKKFSDHDLFFIGGGQDSQQELVAKDLMQRKTELREAIDSGAVMLAICGGYQMLGNYYQTSEGANIDGLGILDIETLAPKIVEGKRQDRLIGNVVLESLIDGTHIKHGDTIVGFENHSGRTHFMSDDVKALGKVKRGFGNNDKDGLEGINYKNLFGTYLHGSLLPKNPKLTDELIFRALSRKNPNQEILKEINDELENEAHKVAVSL